jgi:hypothetical protein
MMGLILKEELAGKSNIKKQLIDAWHEHGTHPFGMTTQQDSQQTSAHVRSAKQLVDQRESRQHAGAGWLTQFAVLFGRSWRGAIISYIQPLPIIQITVISVLVGLIWLRVPQTIDRVRDRLGALFFIGSYPMTTTTTFGKLGVNLTQMTCRTICGWIYSAV